MCFFAPKEINNVFTIFVDGPDGLFSESFPAFLGMRIAFASLDR